MRCDPHGLDLAQDPETLVVAQSASDAAEDSAD